MNLVISCKALVYLRGKKKSEKGLDLPVSFSAELVAVV